MRLTRQSASAEKRYIAHEQGENKEQGAWNINIPRYWNVRGRCRSRMERVWNQYWCPNCRTPLDNGNIVRVYSGSLCQYLQTLFVYNFYNIAKLNHYGRQYKNSLVMGKLKCSLYPICRVIINLIANSAFLDISYETMQRIPFLLEIYKSCSSFYRYWLIMPGLWI